MKAHTLFIILLFFACNLFGQSTFDFDTINVSTISIPLKLNQTGRNITVLDNTDIQELTFNSMDELLQTVSGVEVQSRGGFGAQADISLRGSTFTQVLILLDGQRMNDPLTGHFNGYIPVTPAEIFRIEILRGPASAIYGPDAVGGVINIITNTFAKQQKEEMINKGSFSYGENELVNVQHGFFSNEERFKIGGGFNISKSEGEIIPEMITADSTVLEEYTTFFDIKQASVSLGYDIGNGLSIAARTAYDDRHFNARYFFTASPFDKSVESTQAWWNQMRISKLGEKGSTSLDLSFKQNDDVFVFSPDFPSTNTHRTKFFNANLGHLYAINNALSLKVGLQFDRRSIVSNDRGDHDNIHYGAYSMLHYVNDSGLNATLGLRVDYDDNYDVELSPQLNLSYVLNQIVLRGAVGRSIRAGDYTERFVSNNLANLTPGRSLGNPDLEAEQAWSQEIGIDVNLTRDIKLKATGFSRQSDNLIDFVSTNESEIGAVGDLQIGENYFFAKNISSVTTSGFEVEAYLEKSFGESTKVKWGLGYTFLNTTTDNDDDLISVYISSHARHLLTSNLRLQIDRFYLNLNSLYKDRPERIATAINTTLNESYFVHNAKIGAHFTSNFGLFVQVQNIGDIEYQNILGARMPSRWFQAGFHWNL